MASALRASALRAAPSAHSARLRLAVEPAAGLTHLRFAFPTCPAGETQYLRTTGGGRWIRTTEGVSQQIYSLPPLAAWVSLRSFLVERRRSPSKSPLFWPSLSIVSTAFRKKMESCRADCSGGGRQAAGRAQTLKRKCSTSPSCTRYSLPSRRKRPASRAPASPRYLMKSS